jgi:hypothetical protein
VQLLADTWDLHAAIAAAKAGKKARRREPPRYPRPRAAPAPAATPGRRRRTLADFARSIRPRDFN